MRGGCLEEENAVMNLRLKGKPKCPACNLPLTFVFEGTTGFISVKCSRCKKTSMINTETLDVHIISKVG